MNLKIITQARNLENKRVLVRVDFNVPISTEGVVLDDTKLRASLKTIQYLRKQKAKVILISHLGRPQGKKVKGLSLEPIAKYLGKLLRIKVTFVNHFVGTPVEKIIDRLRPGQVLLLENIRFSSDEKQNKGTFARELSSLGDIFVLDGFGVAHRANASVVGIAKMLPAYAGYLLKTEVQSLEKLMHLKKSPFVAVFGGAKIETKIPVIKKILPKVDHLLLGGGLFTNYLAAKGYEIGKSIVNSDYLVETKKYGSHKKVVLPIDVLVGTKSGSKFRVVEVGDKPHRLCSANEAVYDIGPATIQQFSNILSKAKKLIWNGAMGYFEQEPYNIGTFAIAHLLAEYSKRGAYTVIGGGETVLSVNQLGLINEFNLVSTGGGAMLEFLSGKTLPGFKAFIKK